MSTAAAATKGTSYGLRGIQPDIDSNTGLLQTLVAEKRRIEQATHSANELVLKLEQELRRRTNAAAGETIAGGADCSRDSTTKATVGVSAISRKGRGKSVHAVFALRARIREARARHIALTHQLERVAERLKGTAASVPHKRSRDIHIKVACFKFAYALSNDSTALLSCLQRWCRREPLPGLSSIDQHTFVFCVFAAAKANLEVSTKRGVTLFSHTVEVADILYGRHAQLDTQRELVTRSFVYDFTKRHFEGVRPGTDTFNIPYRCMHQNTLAHLGELMCASKHERSSSSGNGNNDMFVAATTSATFLPFTTSIAHDISRDLTHSGFVYNEFLSDALDPLRNRLIRMYAAYMILDTAKREDVHTLADVTNGVLDALHRSHSYAHVIAKMLGVDVSSPVLETLRRGAAIANDGNARAALVDVARRYSCRRACDYVTKRYLNTPLEEILRILFDYEFM